MSCRTRPLLSAMAIALGVLLHPLPALAEIHTMIVTSDPQYPWKDETPGAPTATTEDELAQRSLAMITEQYDSIAAYREARKPAEIPVFINGDLTAYGHGWQRAEMEKLYRRLGDNIHLGLGNHDYANNLYREGGHGCFNNGCARDSVLGLAAHVRAKPTISFDFGTHPGMLETRHDGSLAYAVEAPGMDRVINVQLNYFPEYAVSFKSAGYRFDLGSSLPWLSTLFQENLSVPRFGTPADRNYDFAVVHVHDPSKLGGDFDALASTSDVVAVFAGHFHGILGRYDRADTSVPVFLSGSASNRTYLIVEHDTDAELLHVYAVRDNDPEHKAWLETLPTAHRKRR